jgi:hypothetical protein
MRVRAGSLGLMNLLFSVGLCACCQVVTTANAEKREPFPPAVEKVVDPDRQVEFALRFAKNDVDGAAYGIWVSIYNTSTNRDFVLEVNDEDTTAFQENPTFLLTIGGCGSKGKVLRSKVVRISSHGRQTYRAVTIPPRSVHEWYLPIAEYLPDNTFPEERLEGCKIFVNIMGLEGRPITLYDTNVLLTRHALEANPTKRYDRAKPAAK